MPLLAFIIINGSCLLLASRRSVVAARASECSSHFRVCASFARWRAHFRASRRAHERDSLGATRKHRANGAPDLLSRVATGNHAVQSQLSYVAAGPQAPVHSCRRPLSYMEDEFRRGALVARLTLVVIDSTSCGSIEQRVNLLSAPTSPN